MIFFKIVNPELDWIIESWGAIADCIFNFCELSIETMDSEEQEGEDEKRSFRGQRSEIGQTSKKKPGQKNFDGA